MVDILELFLDSSIEHKNKFINKLTKSLPTLILYM